MHFGPVPPESSGWSFEGPADSWTIPGLPEIISRDPLEPRVIFREMSETFESGRVRIAESVASILHLEGPSFVAFAAAPVRIPDDPRSLLHYCMPDTWRKRNEGNKK